MKYLASKNELVLYEAKILRAGCDSIRLIWIATMAAGKVPGLYYLLSSLLIKIRIQTAIEGFLAYVSMLFV